MNLVQLAHLMHKRTSTPDLALWLQQSWSLVSARTRKRLEAGGVTPAGPWLVSHCRIAPSNGFLSCCFEASGGQDKAIIKVFDNGLRQTLRALSLSTRHMRQYSIKHTVWQYPVSTIFPAHASINVPYHRCCCVTTVAGRFLKGSEIKDACGQL